MTPKNPGRTQSCTRAQATRRRQDAHEFLAAADLLLADETLLKPGTSSAVLAGIAAADAICGLLLGRWAHGADHSQAVSLLESVILPKAIGTTSTALATKLTRLLELKNASQYTGVPLARATAHRALENATTLVDIADLIH